VDENRGVSDQFRKMSQLVAAAASPRRPVTVAGAGLAGSEAAWQLALRNIPVRLLEMKPARFSPAHRSPDFGELVCSNSLRSASLTSGPGLLKAELRILGSLVMEAADATAVPAGKALAVDRDRFARYITDRLLSHPLVTVQRAELTEFPPAGDDLWILATGPLTSPALAESIAQVLGAQSLAFYDAIAPIVVAESLDTSKLFRASRYGDGEGDYLNAPLDETTYRKLVNALVEAEKTSLHPFEDMRHFEGCLPIEVMAARGPETLAFGPLKPVGLEDPLTGRRPYAVAQLRAENRERTLYNMVGFQTKLTYSQQERVFRMIPGLERAVFARLGSAHRNTYLDAPRVLDEFSRARSRPNVFFAGQITGVEGYIESTASGLAAGLFAGLIRRGVKPPHIPTTTAVGALLGHTRNTYTKRYDPMNVNFGIIDAPEAGTPKKSRKEVLAQRALEDITRWRSLIDDLWAEIGPTP
jgi:methylenetetrahydrofolate--tRNA-(uracil-5-)-methyltransferase